MHNDDQNTYTTDKPMTEQDVLTLAADILQRRFTRGEALSSAVAAKDFLQMKLAGNDREVFAILLLDSQHRLIEYQEVFFGTINSSMVHPREIVKAALKANACAVILAHNHPSGVAEPSPPDRMITKTLVDALDLIDVRVLDHIVVGSSCLSFAEEGLL